MPGSLGGGNLLRHAKGLFSSLRWTMDDDHEDGKEQETPAWMPAGCECLARQPGVSQFVGKTARDGAGPGESSPSLCGIECVVGHRRTASMTRS